MSWHRDIKQRALELGFDLVGITDASSIDTEQAELLADWLAFGFAGRMSYMHRNFEKRIDPAKLLENAHSVIFLGLNYTPPRCSPSFRALRSNAQRSHLRRTTTPVGRIGLAGVRAKKNLVKTECRCGTTAQTLSATQVAVCNARF